MPAKPKYNVEMIKELSDGFRKSREIAEIVGISTNHVGVKLNRIKKRLTKEMEGCDDAS